MLESADMQSFALGCKALEYAKTPEAYELLKSYLSTADKYRLRCVYEAVFSYKESAQLRDEFGKALLSDESMFVNCALSHLIHKNLWASNEQILLCFEKNQNKLDPYYYQILSTVPKSETAADKICALFIGAQTDSLKIALGELLPDFALESNYMKLYEMLSRSNMAKLRMQACRIAKKFGETKLLESFTEDPDGHIRKYVSAALEGNSDCI